MTLETAVKIAMGEIKIADDAAPKSIRGAQNNYNAKGRGSTMARRVLRNGMWQWVSAPASRGRFLTSDRKDARYGDVWVGEIVSQYTLGGRGTPEPDYFWLVTNGDAWAVKLEHTKRRDGQYALTLPGVADKLIVANPNWR